jgi:transcriptional regulator with XRE-family HTH domain
MVAGPNEDDHAPNNAYARDLGARLRAIRTQQHLSLHGVERKSEGRWKAVVIGSYERGDRAISVQRLAELADFYGVPVGELLPRDNAPAAGGPAAAPLARVVINLTRLRGLSDPDAAPLLRFVASIQRMRGDYANQTLTVRAEDLRTLALLFDTTPEGISSRLVRWQILTPQSVILDGEP